MAERPILFSGPMVNAIRQGRKTQTRRVIDTKGVPDDEFAADLWLSKGKCPYGAPGDQLWVRETWGFVNAGGWAVEPSTLRWRADGNWRLVGHQYLLAMHEQYAIGHVPMHLYPREGWRPSIHMPRWASRITLDITNVRVERLQDISPADVQSEGCTGSSFGPEADAILFPALWDSISAKKHPWSSNPWVWVVEFKRK